jgi:hypothetical protein
LTSGRTLRRESLRVAAVSQKIGKAKVRRKNADRVKDRLKNKRITSKRVVRRREKSGSRVASIKARVSAPSVKSKAVATRASGKASVGTNANVKLATAKSKSGPSANSSNTVRSKIPAEVVNPAAVQAPKLVWRRKWLGIRNGGA